MLWWSKRCPQHQTKLAQAARMLTPEQLTGSVPGCACRRHTWPCAPLLFDFGSSGDAPPGVLPSFVPVAPLPAPGSFTGRAPPAWESFMWNGAERRPADEDPSYKKLSGAALKDTGTCVTEDCISLRCLGGAHNTSKHIKESSKTTSKTPWPLP